MRIKRLIRLFLLISLFLLIYFFVHRKEKIIINRDDIEQFEDFDIIVSSGQSLQSRLLSIFDFSLESFTHIGLVCEKNGKIYILHATPDGAKENGIRYDDLQTFIDLSEVNHYKVLRLKNQIMNQNTINQYVEEYRTNRYPFDYDFDNNEREKLYCSELVYDVFTRSGIKLKIDLSKPIYPKIFTQLNEFRIVCTRKSTSNSNR